MGRLRALTVITALLLLSFTVAYASSVLTISGDKFNTHVPTVYDITDLKPSWSALIETNLRWHNSTSAFGVDFLYSSNGGVEADSSGINAYEQTGGWFQNLKVQGRADGKVFIYFLHNSTAGSAIKIYESPTGTWGSGYTGTNPEATTVKGNPIFVAVYGNKLYVGEVKGNTLTYWVEGFALPEHGLGVEGLSKIGAYGATYTSGGQTTPASESGDGYVQITFNPPTIYAGSATKDATNLLLAFLPLVIVMAVIGVVLKGLKNMKL